jgi:hypothetical protein
VYIVNSKKRNRNRKSGVKTRCNQVIVMVYFEVITVLALLFELMHKKPFTMEGLEFIDVYTR